jgi:hypothetical protein
MIAKRNIQTVCGAGVQHDTATVKRCSWLTLASRGTSGERAGERGFQKVFRNNAPPLPAPLLRSAEEREFTVIFFRMA